MKFENDMLYLSLCALNNTKPDVERVEKMDSEALYKTCKKHNISALVCYALEMVITPQQKWQEEKSKAVGKNLLFDVERKQITSFMDKNGIKYLPLKGIILKEYYPKTGMRQMSDNDIYYDESFKEKVEAFMLSTGYQLVSKDSCHYVYQKPPIYNFEMHHSLFEETSKSHFRKYYSDLEKRLIKDEASNACHMSDEDFYIYIIAHEYKHYSTSGTGIRSLLDCYILLNRFENQLDWEYIKSEIDKLGLTDFEETQRQLCKKLSVCLDTVDFTKEEVEMLNYF
ncbi:MAG: nucleotidyltransferase family protein, partial [Acutalibacteraceae bacterium]|nr:nucleotidyltransferase family protein [Acutalibacteraceae bacterium]